MSERKIRLIFSRLYNYPVRRHIHYKCTSFSLALNMLNLTGNLGAWKLDWKYAVTAGAIVYIVYRGITKRIQVFWKLLWCVKKELSSGIKTIFAI